MPVELCDVKQMRNVAIEYHAHPCIRYGTVYYILIVPVKARSLLLRLLNCSRLTVSMF